MKPIINLNCKITLRHISGPDDAGLEIEATMEKVGESFVVTNRAVLWYDDEGNEVWDDPIVNEYAEFEQAAYEFNSFFPILIPENCAEYDEQRKPRCNDCGRELHPLATTCRCEFDVDDDKFEEGWDKLEKELFKKGLIKDDNEL